MSQQQQQQHAQLVNFIPTLPLVQALLESNRVADNLDSGELFGIEKERVDTMLSLLDKFPTVDGTRPIAAYLFYPKYVYQAARYEDPETALPLLVPSMLTSCSLTLTATHPHEANAHSSLQLMVTPRIYDSEENKWIFIHNEIPRSEVDKGREQEQKQQQEQDSLSNLNGSTMDFYDQLPDELLKKIFSFLDTARTDYNFLLVLLFVNGRFNRIFYEIMYTLDTHIRVQWISFEHLCNFSTTYGYLNILKWIKTIYFSSFVSFSVLLCSHAAQAGHLEIIKWARENGCNWDERTCSLAVAGGHLEVLKWLKENGCPWNHATCSSAACHGHLEVLKWLKENGCPWDESTCCSAAANGHLEILKWAKDNGCPWDDSTCTNAASNGHLEVLKWARKNGCGWSHMTYFCAKSNRHLEVLEWLEKNGCAKYK